MNSRSTGATEVRCEHCGEPVAEAMVPCPRCGRAPSAAQMGEGPAKKVYLALVMANVLRLRRQWGLAEAKCSEVLRRDPENAAAYSVLGDISRDQGKLRDAIEWYKMALDRKPESAVDRTKLEAVIDQVFSEPGKGMVARAGTAIGRGLGTVAADVRAARPPSAAAVVLGGVLGLILLIAVLAILIGRGREPGTELTGRDAAGGAFAGAELAGAGPRIEGGGRAEPAGPATFEADLISIESSLLAELEGRAAGINPNCRVVSVEIDPEEAVARLHVSMPRMWQASATRESVRRVIASLAAAAATWDERIAGVEVRCDVWSAAGSGELALLAKGTAGEVAKAEGAAGARMEEYFSSVWWHPGLREEAGERVRSEG